jgi:hypothetical protein
VTFPFIKIDKLTVKLGPEQLTPAEQEMIYGTMRASAFLQSWFSEGSPDIGLFPKFDAVRRS